MVGPDRKRGYGGHRVLGGMDQQRKPGDDVRFGKRRGLCHFVPLDGPPERSHLPFTVTATNAAGTGTASASVAATPYTRAGPPANLTAVALPGGQVHLNWAPPGDNGGATVTGYRIERRGLGGEWAVLVSDTANPLTSYLAISLDSAVSYEFQVSAWNAAGMGTMSTPSQAVQPVAPPTTTTVAPTTTTVAPTTTTVAPTTTTVAPTTTSTRPPARGMVPPRPVYIG